MAGVETGIQMINEVSVELGDRVDGFNDESKIYTRKLKIDLKRR